MISFTKVTQSLGAHWDSYESLFRTALSSPYALLSTIDAYLLNQPGKQVRPMLSLIAAHIAGTPLKLSHTVAVVGEMIHTASLLHDDVADNAETRRGRLSVQKMFGAQASILLGDFWLARAFQLMVDNNGLHLMSYFADAVRELSEGELLQMEKAQTLDVTLDEYFTICNHKTASLFRAVIMAAFFSVPEKEKAQTYAPYMEQIAYHVGMAFQIKDDILDYQPLVNKGKPSYLDITESKITLPLLGAMENAGASLNRPKVSEWIQQTAKGSQIALQHIIRFVEENEGLTYATRILDAHMNQVRDNINKIPPSSWRDLLQDTVESVIYR